MSNIPLTDLRIGNIVYTYDNQQDNIDQECIITALNDNGTLGFRWPDEDFNRNASIEHFEVIPINEEWLINFGFILLPFEEYEVWEHDTMAATRLEYDADCYWIQTAHMNNNNEMEWVVCSKDLNHVNDLQNAWYFLTGTELTLK